MSNTLVIKFGGKTLQSTEKLRECTKQIIKLKDKFANIVVIVSAMGDTTNILYKMYLETTAGNVNTKELERFITLGEIQSAILFEALLHSVGVKAKTILPYEPSKWPIVVEREELCTPSQQKINDEFQYTLIVDIAKERMDEILQCLKDNIVIILPGFVALDKNNNIITLGRGGSDTSAAIISNLLDADNLYIVTDVEGVLSGDPQIVKNPHPIKKLTLRELQIIAGAGGRVVHPDVLRYVKPKTHLRIVDAENILKDGGTVIEVKRDIELKPHRTPIGVVTLLGNNLLENPALLINLFHPLSQLGIPILDITVNPDYIALYIDEDRAENVYKVLHSLVNNYSNVFKSVAMKKSLGKITVSSVEFIDTPGILYKLIKPISEKSINIYEMVTVMKDITIFTDFKNISQIEGIIKDAMGLA